MKYTQAKQGRIFVLRLEQGDIIPNTIECFAKEKDIKSAIVMVLGGADEGSQIISGPINGKNIKPKMGLNINTLKSPYETTGFGTIFLNCKEEPQLHLHLACGKEDNTISGCTRNGVLVWMYMEIIIIELIECNAKRHIDKESGFALLEI